MLIAVLTWWLDISSHNNQIPEVQVIVASTILNILDTNIVFSDSRFVNSATARHVLS